MKVWSWRQLILKSELAATTKLVLLTLSTYMNEHGDGCYPSVEQIAEDASLTPRAVYEHIRKAEEAGFLLKDKRRLSGKKWAANEYTAAMPEIKPRPARKVPAESDMGSDEPRSENIQEVNDVHPLRDEPDSPQGLRGEPRSHMGCTRFSDGVNHVHTNSPMNSTMNSEDEDACEDGGEDFHHPPEVLKILGSFNEVYREVWCDGRRMRSDDYSAATAFLTMELEVFTTTLRRVMWEMKLAGRPAPSGLSYFEKFLHQRVDDKPAEKSRPPARQKATAPPRKLTDLERAKAFKVKRKFGVILDRAEEMFLKKFEDQHGELTV